MAIPPTMSSGRRTLLSFLQEERAAQPTLVDEDLHLVLAAIASAVKRISYMVRRAGIVDLTGLYTTEHGGEVTLNKGGEKQKKLDVLANDILKEHLQDCGYVAAFASEEEDGVIPLRTGGKFVVVLDPLDGSSNVDASIPTGTIFGVYRSLGDSPAQLQAGALQAGKHQVAAGYCLFSAATLLVLTMGRGTGTHVLTLDHHIGDFVLTTRRLRLPLRGSTYSLNEARFGDWPEGLQRYVTDMKLGRNQKQTPYDLVYVCSLVADAHWVLIRGGMACNPRSHLRLCFEGNPMSLVTEEAGGLASSGDGPRILNIVPDAIHQRTPVFLGSRDDILELESYGDVAQKHNPGYA
ncbi:fructose-bisphosphatase [Nannochloropsis oceanica]